MATRASDWWSRLEAVFQEARPLPADAVSRYLDVACEGDRKLRAEVEALLRVDVADAALRIERLVREHAGAGSLPDDRHRRKN
jgi:hypothetical protein